MSKFEYIDHMRDLCGSGMFFEARHYLASKVPNAFYSVALDQLRWYSEITSPWDLLAYFNSPTRQDLKKFCKEILTVDDVTQAEAFGVLIGLLGYNIQYSVIRDGDLHKFIPGHRGSTLVKSTYTVILTISNLSFTSSESSIVSSGFFVPNKADQWAQKTFSKFGITRSPTNRN